jgi:hypothetical protein
MIDAGQAVFFGSVADKVTGRDAAGRLVITEDNTHPVLPTGHAVYADTVMRGIRAMAADDSAKQIATALPPPLIAATWETARTVPAEGNAVFTGMWQKLDAENGPACSRFDRRIYDWFPHLLQTGSPGASVSIRLRGTVIGIRGMTGPDSGIVEVKVDDQPAREINQFTVYNTRWAYIGDTLPELPPGEHTITWTLSRTKPDKAAILASYYRKDNDRDLRENPAKYEPTVFSVGEIAVIGEIVPTALPER